MPVYKTEHYQGQDAGTVQIIPVVSQALSDFSFQ